MRRMLLLFVCLSASAGEVDTFEERVIRFHNRWNAFVRTYLGCPKGALRVEECDRKLGVIDYAEFTKAAKEGRKLFDQE